MLLLFNLKEKKNLKKKIYQFLGTNLRTLFSCNICEKEQRRNPESIAQQSPLFIHKQHCTRSSSISVLQKTLLGMHTYRRPWLLWAFPHLCNSSALHGVFHQNTCCHYNCCFSYWSCSYVVGVRCSLNNSRKPEEGAQEQKTPKIRHFNLYGYFSWDLKKTTKLKQTNRKMFPGRIPVLHGSPDNKDVSGSSSRC